MVANWESNVGYAWWLMENFWTTIAAHFEKQGVASHLIYPKITVLPVAIESSNIEVEECDFRDRSFNNIKKIRGLIKSKNIKYIYLSDSPSYSLFYLLLKLWGVKKIVVHDHTPGERTVPAPWLRLAKSLIQRIPVYTADHYIAVTDFVYRRFIDVSCIPAEKCSVAANGIRPLDLSSADLKYTYKMFSIPEDRKIIITTGRASFYKGIDFFIECANELVNHKKIAKLHFLYCGDGPDLNAFRSLSAKYKLESSFTFAGKRSDVTAILPSCHIGFHAAKGEVGYSLSILEYMSAGLATIVPDNPSTSGATVDGKTGMVYQPGNVSSACSAIEQCLDESLRKKLSANAIASVKQQYNIANTNSKLIASLERVFI